MTYTRSPLAGLLAAATTLACGGTIEMPGPDANLSNTSDAGMANSALCPPEGPFGLGISQPIPNVNLADCDGNPVELHDLCARKAAYFFVHASW